MDHIGTYRGLISQSHRFLNCGVSHISQYSIDTKELMLSLQILEETLLKYNLDKQCCTLNTN